MCNARSARCWCTDWCAQRHGVQCVSSKGENCFAEGGGGWHGSPFAQTPPPPALVAMPGGGFGPGLPYLPCRGVDPNIYGSKWSPRRADHFDYTCVRGEISREKNFSGTKFVFRRLWWQHPSLHKRKGPGTEAHFWNPPPFLCRVPMPSAPPPQSNFRVAKPTTCSVHSAWCMVCNVSFAGSVVGLHAPGTCDGHACIMGTHASWTFISVAGCNNQNFPSSTFLPESMVMLGQAR